MDTIACGWPLNEMDTVACGWPLNEMDTIACGWPLNEMDTVACGSPLNETAALLREACYAPQQLLVFALSMIGGSGPNALKTGLRLVGLAHWQRKAQ